MKEHRYTLLGVLAILAWSSTFAVGRPLIEALGPLTATAGMYLLGGFLGTALMLRSRERWENLTKLPRKYLFVCGGLFALFALTLYLSIGLVSTRQQVIEIGVINFLWPTLTVLFALPILGYHARPTLVLGLSFATAGVFFTAINGQNFSFDQIINNFRTELIAYLLAFIAACCWALYSLFCRAWAGASSSNAVPLFILATGVLLLPLRFVFGETSEFTWRAILELSYMAIVPTFLAYVFWDMAIKKGDVILIASLSYFTPVVATILSCVYLDLESSWQLWLGCTLVVIGSYISKMSVVEKPTEFDIT